MMLTAARESAIREETLRAPARLRSSSGGGKRGVEAPSERVCRGSGAKPRESNARARRSASHDGSEASKRRARECVGGLGAKPREATREQGEARHTTGARRRSAERESV